MRLSEDTSLAVPRPTSQQLLHAVERAREELGIMCDVYQDRIIASLDGKNRSVESVASSKMINEISAGFFMRILDLNDYLQNPGIQEEVFAIQQGVPSHLKLYTGEGDEFPEPDPHVLPFPASAVGQPFKVFENKHTL
jgi:hypothetical protein